MEKPGDSIICRIVSLKSYIWWNYPLRFFGGDFFINDWPGSRKSRNFYY